MASMDNKYRERSIDIMVHVPYGEQWFTEEDQLQLLEAYSKAQQIADEYMDYIQEKSRLCDFAVSVYNKGKKIIVSNEYGEILEKISPLDFIIDLFKNTLSWREFVEGIDPEYLAPLSVYSCVVSAELPYDAALMYEEIAACAQEAYDIRRREMYSAWIAEIVRSMEKCCQQADLYKKELNRRPYVQIVFERDPKEIIDSISQNLRWTTYLSKGAEELYEINRSFEQNFAQNMAELVSKAFYGLAEENDRPFIAIQFSAMARLNYGRTIGCATSENTGNIRVRFGPPWSGDVWFQLARQPDSGIWSEPCQLNMKRRRCTKKVHQMDMKLQGSFARRSDPSEKSRLLCA